MSANKNRSKRSSHKEREMRIKSSVQRKVVNSIKRVQNKKTVKLKKGVSTVKGLHRNIVKQKLKRKLYAAEYLERAVTAVKHGVNLRKAASDCGVPVSTLSRRVNNPHKIYAKSGPQTVLSKEDEEKIVDWMIHRAKTGCPVNKDELLDSIQSYLNAEGKHTAFISNRPGRRWYEGFMKRHPNVSVRKAQNLTSSRANVTEEDLREWFEEIRLYLQTNNLISLPPSRIFNCDETSVELCPSTKRVFAKKGSASVYNVVGGSDKECLTALFMFSAVGKRVPPMILFKGKTTISANILKRTPKDWGLGMSENGWMTAETFHEYFTLVFYPWLLMENVEFPIIVYMDGHSSHMSIPLVTFCRENGIHLILLFANSTHLVQPLDIAYFHPLKEFWKKVVRIWKRNNKQSQVTKETFPEVLKLTIDTYTGEATTVVNGFEKAGLFPFNPDAVEYNTLDKKTKKRVKSKVQDTTEAVQVPIKEEIKFLAYFEKKLDPGLKILFEISESKNEWVGPIESRGLYEYWLKIKEAACDLDKKQTSKNDIRIVTNIRDTDFSQFEKENIKQLLEAYEIHKNLKNHQSQCDVSASGSTQANVIVIQPENLYRNAMQNSSCDVDSIEKIDIDFLNSSKHEKLLPISDNCAKIIFENCDLSNTLPAHSQANIVNFEVCQNNNLTGTEPTIIIESDNTEGESNQLDEIPVEHLISEFELINNDCHEGLEEKISEYTVPKGAPESIIGNVISSPPQDQLSSLSARQSVISEKDSSSMNDDENHKTSIGSRNFEGSFLFPAKYLPKKKKTELEKRGKTKKPSVATSEARWVEMMEVQKEKDEQEQQAKERKLLQDAKKKLADEKKRLDMQIREIQAKLKRDSKKVLQIKQEKE